MFDRVLLILLLILLPVGIVASRLWTGDISFGQSSSVDEKKVEEIVQRMSQQTPTQSTSSGSDFNITAVMYASESATLKIVGMAPNNQQLMWVWTASTRTKSKKTTSLSVATMSAQTNPMWDGPLVIQPGVGGLFSVEANTSLMDGIVEVRLEQGKSVTVVRYDLDKHVQLTK